MSGTVKKGLSDQRLLFILQGGDIFMYLFDPENLCKNGVVRRVVHGFSSEDVAVSWEASVIFKNGDCLIASGAWTVSDGLSIWELKMPLPDGMFETIPSLPGKTLLSALGELSGTPVRLKRCLSPTGPKMGDYAKVSSLWGNRLFEMEEDALFWDVEGGEKESGNRKLFKTIAVSYTRNETNGPMKASMVSSAPLKEGRILCSTELDIYGLGSRKVVLDRNVGLGHRAEIKCTARVNDRVVPSLKMALDLDSVLPILYFKERHKTLSRGKPKVSSK